MDKVELPGGGWAEFGDFDTTITEGTRQKALAVWDGGNSSAFVADLQAFRVVLADLIIGWSLDMPLPNGDASRLDRVPITAMNALYEALRPDIRKLWPDFSPNPRADSPIEPSTG